MIPVTGFVGSFVEIANSLLVPWARKTKVKELILLDYFNFSEMAIVNLLSDSGFVTSR